MTDINPNGSMPPAQKALHDIATGGDHGGDNTDALSTLAHSDVLLPVPGESGEAESASPRVIELPVYEQEDGARLVPVFTSEVRMAHALPNTHRYRVVPLAALSGYWPSDELTLSIDSGSPDALTISGAGVRALATLSGGPGEGGG